MDYVEKYSPISITFFKNNGYLKGGNSFYNRTLTWSRGGEIEARIGFNLVHINEDLKRLILKYTFNKIHDIEYSVDIVSFPSNLGIGKRWYFICPKTNRRCMKLLRPDNSHYFYHRTAFGLYYKLQTRTVGDARDIVRIFAYFDKSALLLERLKKKHSKLYYKGKPTRLLNRFESYELKIPKHIQY